MKRLCGIALLIATTSVQASHWVPVATGPDWDTTGLYLDKDSIKGTFPVRSVWQKFVNSYRAQRLSLVEFNCARGTWRTLKVISRAPNGSVLNSENFPNAKSSSISHDSFQKLASKHVCNAAGQATRQQRN